MGLYVMSRCITEMGIGGRMENGSRDSCLSMLDDEEKRVVETEDMMVMKDGKEENDGYFLDSSSSSSSSVSSIGKDSDEEIVNDNDDDEEVQSNYNKVENGPFDSLQALEEALPTRKGMSRFYVGKSKSFTRLADASSYSSIREIAKPADFYSKRRRNSFARRLMVNKHNSSPLKISGGISKRSSNTRRSTLALAVKMTNTSKNSDTVEDQDSSPSSYSSLSPHYSQIRLSKFNSSCCTASFADLEQCASLKTSAPL